MRNIRNPVLELPAVRKLQALPPEQRKLLAELLAELRGDCLEKAEHSWRKHKAPMAAYWKACGVYAGHVRRAILA